MNLSFPSTGEKPLSDLHFPVEYSLSELSLTSYAFKDGLDLRPYLIELNYFEDIFNNFVSAKLVLSDAVGILLLGGLNGTETVRFRFCSGTGGQCGLIPGHPLPHSPYLPDRWAFEGRCLGGRNDVPCQCESHPAHRCRANRPENQIPGDTHCESPGC